jgi:hypothetical protein
MMPAPLETWGRGTSRVIEDYRLHGIVEPPLEPRNSKQQYRMTEAGRALLRGGS